MSNKYILSIDQSTQATKGLLFDSQGSLIMRYDMPHEQIIDNQGFVEHNPNEIYENTIKVVKAVVERADINKDEILGLGISNQIWFQPSLVLVHPIGTAKLLES